MCDKVYKVSKEWNDVFQISTETNSNNFENEAPNDIQVSDELDESIDPSNDSFDHIDFKDIDG